MTSAQLIALIEDIGAGVIDAWSVPKKKWQDGVDESIQSILTNKDR